MGASAPAVIVTRAELQHEDGEYVRRLAIHVLRGAPLPPREVRFAYRDVPQSHRQFIENRPRDVAIIRYAAGTSPDRWHVVAYSPAVEADLARDGRARSLS